MKIKWIVDGQEQLGVAVTAKDEHGYFDVVCVDGSDDYIHEDQITDYIYDPTPFIQVNDEGEVVSLRTPWNEVVKSMLSYAEKPRDIDWLMDFAEELREELSVKLEELERGGVDNDEKI